MAINSVSNSQHQKIFMPTEEQLKTAYTSITQAALKDHSAKKLAHAPKNFAKYPSYDVTPKGLCGVGYKCYVIKGELILASTPVTLHPKTTWYDCGPMPLF